MRILFVSTIGSSWGGSEELWSQAAATFLSQQAEVAVSVGYYGILHPKLLALQSRGARIMLRKSFLRDNICKVLDKYGLYKVRSYIKNSFENHILQVNPELVVFSQATCYGAYKQMLFCKMHQIPYCSVSQLNTEFDWPNDQNFEWISEAFKSATKAFFVSMANLELFQKQIGERLENSRVISNPFSFEEIPNFIWPASDVIRIAHVARIDFSHKGTDILLECFAQAQWRSRKFMLSIYGSGNIALAKKLSKYLGTVNVVFKGHVEDVTSIWRENHLLVLPSRYEGMPLALIEAMLCGRPAVVTEVAGHAELIAEGRNGFVADAASVKHFSCALERAWDNRHLLPALGQNARKDALRLITTTPVDSFVEELHRIYRRVYGKQ